MEIVPFLQELSKCGYPFVDSVTGECKALKLVNGKIYIDQDPITVETFKTFSYTIANPASPASGTLTLTGNLSEGDQVVIGSQTYTATATVDAAYEVLIGATASDTIDNLIAAINNDAGAGTLYGATTPANTSVSASVGAGDTMDVTSDGFFYGAVADAIATTETSATASWGATTLTLDAATVSLSVNGTNFSNDPYEITSSGTSDKSTTLLAADAKALVEAEGVSVVASGATVSGTDYVLTLTVLAADEAALTAIDIERDGVAVTPVIS